MIRRHITFYGRVQGIGFQCRARHAAKLYGCIGWVRNEWDGNVTMRYKETNKMKKRITLMLALVLVLSLSACTASPASRQSGGSESAAESSTREEMTSENNDDTGAFGYLSFLNMSEEDFAARRAASIPAYLYLEEHGVIEHTGASLSHENFIFYDTLDAMLMGLLSGEVAALDVPDCTARYLCSENDQVKQVILYHPERAEEFSQDLLNRLGTGYSFMMLEENSELRDQFDEAVSAMKADGTLDRLIKEQIDEVCAGKKAEPITMPEIEGAKTVRVAVTGALPPLDYVAADGTPAGFNTAVLAEISSRAGFNIELVQVDNVGRALALSQGNVDVVFWTRAESDGLLQDGLPSMSDEDRKAYRQEKEAKFSEEENAIMSDLRRSMPFEKYAFIDRPEGTVVTAPYYTDYNVAVVLK